MLISRGHLLLRVEIQMVKFLQPLIGSLEAMFPLCSIQKRFEYPGSMKQRYTVELGQKV